MSEAIQEEEPTLTAGEMEGLARTTLARVFETQLELEEETHIKATDQDWENAMRLLKDQLGIS